MLKIDAVLAKDLDKIAQIELDCFGAHAWSRTLFAQELQDSSKHYLAAFCDDILIGYGGFAQIGDEAHIMNIAVDKNYRGRGVGKMLLAALIERAKMLKIVAVTLEVSELNPVAMFLYEGMGFLLKGRRNDYYNKGEAALIYWLYL